MHLRVTNEVEIDELLRHVQIAAERTQDWIKRHEGDAMSLMRSLKFEAVGCHPIAAHALNVIEQINQTFTYAVALAASRKLLELHPGCGPLLLAPGAHASLPLDVMSEAPKLIGAETFAAVTPRNNGKLAADLAKLSAREEAHRYVFFASPMYPGTQRRFELEKCGVQVWSLSV